MFSYTIHTIYIYNNRTNEYFFKNKFDIGSKFIIFLLRVNVMTSERRKQHASVLNQRLLYVSEPFEAGDAE